MRPEGRKSPCMDPVHNRKLSTVMKSKLNKSKSPNSLSSKLTIKSPVGQQQLLSLSATQARTRGMSRQAGSSTLDLLPTSTGRNTSIHSRSVFKDEECRMKKEASVPASSRKQPNGPSLKPITPKIMITKCSRLEKLVEEKELVKTKNVLRSKVKSPVVTKLGKFGIKEREMGSKINKGKVLELESQLKKKCSEILSLNRRLNYNQKILSDKEKMITNLESKFPKMLVDLKKGLIDEKKANVELKETIKMNKQLKGNKKLTEDQMKLKDEKLKDMTAVKKKLIEELKSKDFELNEFRQRLASLETNLPDLLSQVEAKEEELSKFRETVEFLEQRLVFQSEENNNQENMIEELKKNVEDLTSEIFAKENELIDLKADNYELHTELAEQYQNLEKTDQETKNYLDIIDNIRGKIESAPLDVKSLHDSIDCLDKATEDFLDKVSAVSKDRNMSFNLKLTVRRSRGGGSFTDQSSGNLGSFLLNPVSYNNNNSTSLSFNNSLSQSSRNSDATGNSCRKRSRGSMTNYFGTCHVDELDEVFEKNGKFEGSNILNITETSNITADASRSDCDISSDTCMRLEELDNKVRSLWSKLSTRDESFEEFKSDKNLEFSNSVSKLKEDLSDSITQHNKFLSQVSVAKKLFSSPAASKTSVTEL